MDKEFEDKGNDDLEDLNNIIFTDTAEEAEQAEDIISSPAPAALYNTSGGASAQPDSARGPEGEQAAGSAHQPTGGAYTFHRPFRMQMRMSSFTSGTSSLAREHRKPGNDTSRIFSRIVMRSTRFCVIACRSFVLR